MPANFPNVRLRILWGLFLVLIFVGAQKIETMNSIHIIQNKKYLQLGSNLEVILEMVRTIGGLDAEENLSFNNPRDIARCCGVYGPTMLTTCSIEPLLTSPRVSVIISNMVQKGKLNACSGLPSRRGKGKLLCLVLDLRVQDGIESGIGCCRTISSMSIF